MATGYDDQEQYLPGKAYPEGGVVSAEADQQTEKLISEYLRGEKSKFGEYRVVEFLGRTLPRASRKGLQAMWRVQCSCGWERVISHDNLSCLRNASITRGNTNCRSPQHDLRLRIGQKYDRLTIIGHVKGKWLGDTPKGITDGTWLLALTCECGKHTGNNPYIAPPSYILSPLSKGQEKFGCGCRNASQDGLSKGRAHQRWENAKARAKKFGLAFNIDVHDCAAPESCPVLGIPLRSEEKGGPTDNSPTLDRIDPSKGYVKGNVAVISNRANRIKNDATVDEIRRVADWLDSTLSKRGNSER